MSVGRGNRRIINRGEKSPHFILIKMKSLLDQVLTTPEFKGIDITIAEYTSLKKKFNNETSTEPIINELNSIVRRDVFYMSVMGCKIS